MCVVSMVYDHYGSGGSIPNNPFIIPPGNPNVSPNLPWTPDLLGEMKKIVKQIEDLDKKLGLGECADPKKADWMKAIEERLAALEKK